MRRQTQSLLALLTLTSALALSGCGNGEAKPDEDKKDESTAIPVETAAVTRGSVAANYSGTATLEAEQEASVVAKVGGVVQRILVEEGARVSAGQILAKLDDGRYKLERDRARANLAKLEQEYERNKQLHERGLVSADAYERIKFDLDALKAQFDLADLEYDYTTIRAPISGVVSVRHIKVGNMVTMNQATFEITDFDPLLAELFVPERELNKLRAGQKAAVSADALPDQSFGAVIDRIGPTVDPKTGTFKVTVAVKDPTRRLKPGMFGRVNVVYDTHANALLVPRSAVVQEDAEAAVFVVKDGIAKRRVVTTGYANNGSLEIATGLAEGEMVVTVGQTSLKDGAKVAVIGAKPTATKVAAKDTAKTKG